MKLNVLLITTQASVLLSGGDYFMENFDETKNCKRENKMKEMQKNKRENCAENRFGITFFLFFSCKSNSINSSNQPHNNPSSPKPSLLRRV